MLADGNTRINGLRSGQFDFIDGLEPPASTELEGVDDLVGLERARRCSST